MAPANDDLSTPGQRDPRALYEAYQKSNDLVHRRQLLRAIFDCGQRPARPRFTRADTEARLRQAARNAESGDGGGAPAAGQGGEASQRQRNAPLKDGAEIWLLLREVRALVAELCSVEAAERLVLDQAHAGGFPHYRGLVFPHYRGLVSDDNHFIDPRIWGKSTRSVHYPAGSVRCRVDWDNSCVSYVRLEVSPYTPEGVVLERLTDFLPAEPAFQMNLVRLPLHDVLAMLHQVGLLPDASPFKPPPEPASAPTSKSEDPPGTGVGESAPSQPVAPGAPGNPMERPPNEADMTTHLEWAYLELLTTNRAAGLRGKALLKAACDEVAPKPPKFTASPSTFKVAKRRAKARLAKARSA